MLRTDAAYLDLITLDTNERVHAIIWRAGKKILRISDNKTTKKRKGEIARRRHLKNTTVPTCSDVYLTNHFLGNNITASLPLPEVVRHYLGVVLQASTFLDTTPSEVVLGPNRALIEECQSGQYDVPPLREYLKSLMCD
jgi:hypothetical protein